MTLQIETLFNTPSRSRFFFPGKIIEGPGVAYEAIGLLSGHARVAIVVDRHFADSKLVQDVRASLPNATVESVTVSGMPFAQDVEDFVARLKAPPDAILSIGGGSATDFAKSIIVYYLFGRVDGVGVGPLAGKAPIPGVAKPLLVSIPTTAGSGAEASRYYVVYDRDNHGKRFGRTWTVIADWILLDPHTMADFPRDLLISCAFDAFVHYFESFVASQERSAYGAMLSLSGIPTLMTAIHDVMNRGIRDASVHQRLLHAATLAGVAISNTRTGSIHEAAGALLEFTTLNHPETLFVFFRDGIEQYREAIRDREALLVAQFSINPVLAGVRSIEDLIAWWEDIFERAGLTAKIRAMLAACKTPRAQLDAHIFERVFSDKVWVTKESPKPIGEAEVNSLIAVSLRRFGLG